MKLSERRIKDFREHVYDQYRQAGRPFPWRNVSDPYDVLVSEIMLQQTQATRVVEYYQRFRKAFPTIADLAAAPLPDVLKLWQGLGYNRRAIMLKRTAEIVVRDHDGKLPDTEAELVKLPGIGSYTAAAVTAFAANRPAVVIETNIRSVYIHEFFGDREGIDDKEILPLIEQTMDREHPREWYCALMDYGVMLKKTGINPSRRSKHYNRQSPFKGSSRQLRGRVLAALVDQERTLRQLEKALAAEPDRLAEAVQALKKDGLVAEQRRKLRLAEAVL